MQQEGQSNFVGEGFPHYLSFPNSSQYRSASSSPLVFPPLCALCAFVAEDWPSIFLVSGGTARW